VLIVAPVSVSSRPVLAEAIVLSVGLLVMLAAHLLLVRRVLAPLHLLTDVMAAIDPHHPGQRLRIDGSATAEVGALSHAFNAMLDRLEDERRVSARRALMAQEDERLRVAREMHDQLGQTLTALTIQAERAAALEDPAERAPLDQIAQTALQALDEVRRIARDLRPEALDDLGLGNALIALCRRMSTQSGVRVTPRLEPCGALRPEVELALYRIAQEAITNALRHAHAAQVDVSLDCGEAVELLVRDDGDGMPEAIDGDTAGLAGMRERALLIGGSLSLRSRVGDGTEVRLAVPLAEARAR
jgi:two-component system sensor histidine kinase UhpB